MKFTTEYAEYTYSEITLLLLRALCDLCGEEYAFQLVGAGLRPALNPVVETRGRL